MQGRYGVDEFAKFTIGAAFVVIVKNRRLMGAGPETIGKQK